MGWVIDSVRDMEVDWETMSTIADSLIEIERVRSAVNRSMNSGVSSESKSWKVCC